MTKPRSLRLVAASFLGALSLGALHASPNLVPDTPNLAPDYFCTWNLQGYVCSYASAAAQRRELTEDHLLGSERFHGWLELYPDVRRDLLFVLDDSWDVPLDGDASWFGSLVLSDERFPSYDGTPAERLQKLADAVKAAGWRGFGGWVCAQRAPRFADEGSEEDYWTERMQWMRDSGVTYWKVDWGEKAYDPAWRKMLTTLGQANAPDLIIEHALAGDTLGYAEVFRTYDVENVISPPVTIDRIAHLLGDPPENSPTLVNCEDEPYIAAGLGCVMGVMRHPFAGKLPDGREDIAFPEAARDLKHRLDEVKRVARWHRIAAPVALGACESHIDSHRFDDFWTLERDETWTPHNPGDRREASAPARISRGLDLPTVTAGTGTAPFVLSTRSANGAVAIATIGRTQDRRNETPKVAVIQPVGDSTGPFGIFGEFGQLTLRFDHAPGDVRLFAQDLAGNRSTEITPHVRWDGQNLILPGELLSRIGLSAATKGDKSEPGLVLVLRPASEGK